jgi:hypothetical protein
MSFLNLFHWLSQTWIGIVMRDSTWGFAIVEMCHLLALAIMGGTVLILDLRLLGLGLRRQAISRIAHELSLLFTVSLVGMVLSGSLLLASGPMRYYYNEAFRFKMLLIIPTIAFQFALLHFVGSKKVELPSLWLRTAAVVSLMLWLSMGLAGRAIGFI